MKEYLKIGDNLRKLRGELSQTDFAKKLNIPFRTYQRYEAGERKPKMAVLHWIATACGVTVEWILSVEETLADRVAEARAPYGSKIEKIMDMLREMDEAQIDEAFRRIQDQKLGAAWRREKKLKEG